MARIGRLRYATALHNVPTEISCPQLGRLSSAGNEITTRALQAAASSIQVGRPCERQRTGHSGSEVRGIADQVSQCQRDLGRSWSPEHFLKVLILELEAVVLEILIQASPDKIQQRNLNN